LSPEYFCRRAASPNIKIGDSGTAFLLDGQGRVTDFCPDVIEQGFGCMDDMLQMAEETGQSISPELMKLLDGIDFSKEDFGLEILQRDLRENKLVRLWWD